MYWITFLALSVALYLPPAYLARRLWEWFAIRLWAIPFVEWPVPAGFAYLFWLVVGYVSVGTLLHLAQRRLPADSRLGLSIVRISRAELHGLGTTSVAVAGLIILLAWPILPLAWLAYGWNLEFSPPVVALAALLLLAESLRMTEDNIWADRAYAAWRSVWLAEQGYET